MTFRKSRLLIGLLLISTLTSIGQNIERPVGFDPKYSMWDLTLDVWTNKNGLVSNNVISVMQSNDDYLWITSYNGLQKFDGYLFEVFDQTNVPYLTSNTFYEGAEDTNGNLWFCTGASGIIGYDGHEFMRLPQYESIPNSITSLYIDQQNNFWIGSKNNGLFKIDKEGKLSKQQEVPSVTIHHITEDSAGDVWVASDNNGVFKIAGNKVSNYTQDQGLSSNLISSVHAHDQTIYVGTSDGLSIIKDGIINNVEVFKGIIINDLHVDDYDVLWMGTEQGLTRYNLANETYEKFSEEDGLPGKRVIDLFFDNESSLWICTYEGGLARFKPGIITNLTIKNGLTTNQVHMIGKNKGQHYIGTQDGSINIYNEHEMKHLTLSSEFRKDVIRDFLFEEDIMWVGNYKGLVKIENGKQTYINTENGLPNNSVRVIFKDSKGTKWLGTRTGGLIRFDEGGNHKVYDKNSGLLTNYVLSLEEDADGNLLIGTNAGGLSILSPEGEISHYSIQNDDTGTLIFNMLVDSENAVWLSTNLGLFQHKDGKATKVNFEPAPKMEKFFDIIEDQAGNFWLSSATGVIRVKREDILTTFNANSKGVSYDLFGEEDGMESQECTGATQSFFDEETGKIWVPTFEGVAIIDPSQKIINTKIPKVYITRVQVDNNSIFPIRNGVEIKPGTFRYLFDVTALSFLAPSKVQIMYKLKGIDDDWNGPTKKRRIEYTNLPYGDYTLLVKASNNDNIWNDEGATLTFTVLPFFFEALWFKVGLVVFLIALFWGLYTWRVYDIKKTNVVLRKMNSELDRFVYSASHDLRGPLTSTMGLVNLATREEDVKQKDEYFRLIKQCTDKMNHFISELINYAKNKNDAIEYHEFELKSLIDSIWEGLKEHTALRNVSLEYDLEGHEKIVSDEIRLRVILRNLLHNAIIFADPQKPSPFIRVQVHQRNSQLELSIIDNGMGIPKKVIDRIFDMFFRASDLSIGSGLGLYVVKETTDKLHASIEVKSEEGKGSTFKVIIPGPKK